MIMIMINNDIRNNDMNQVNYHQVIKPSFGVNRSINE